MPDAPITEPGVAEQFAGYQYCNGPRMHEFLSEMNAILSKYDAMTVGECPNTHTKEGVLKYVSAGAHQLNMVFQFDVVDIGQGPYKFQTTPFAWKLPDLKVAFENTQTLIHGNDAWTTAFLENHDQSRSISRFASDAPEHRVASGKMLALMLAAMSGTLFVYQGQELGMVNVPLDWSVDEYKDVDSSNYYNMVKDRTNGDKGALESAKVALQHLARDHSRVPMQWNNSKHAGFSLGQPWMRVNDDYSVCNAEQQQGDKDSVLSYWKKMLQLRRTFADLFVYGDFNLLDKDDEHVFAFEKEFKGQRALVVLNFTAEQRPFAYSESVKKHNGELVAATVKHIDETALEAFEGRIYLLH